MTIELNNKDYESAMKRGLEEMNKPHAIGAKYNNEESLISIEFNTKVVVIINPKEVKILQGLSNDELSRISITPGGNGLTFGDNVDSFAVSLPGLLAQVLPNLPVLEEKSKPKRKM